MINNLKSFNSRFPKEIWLYLKNVAAEKEISMNEFLLNLLVQHKKKNDKNSLTRYEADV